MPSTKIAQMVPPTEQKGHQSSRWEISLNDIFSLTIGPNSKLFHRIVPHDAFYQNCTNGSAPLNKRAARAPDKKYL